MSLLRDYAAGVTQPTLGGEAVRYDEIVGADGALRTPWKGLAEVAVDLTAEDLGRADAGITRALADDGVTYGRPGERQEPWRLDPMPMVLDAASWNPLEIGLAQRAELLNEILADLYGKQRLLREGLLPPALVLGHPGFMRNMARSSITDPRPLVLTATDLGRDDQGEWRVLADRTQAPSGLGYAMENRRILTRVVPEMYRAAPLHSMEPFFSALRSALIQSAGPDLADPRIVVLSPGSVSETAYDQSFIASALGFPLVQGSDLLVRDGWVQMRVFGRLERVDVILRRVDSPWTDPLELRGDSRLGVAGLVEATRRGRVRIVNGLGAGVLENPALLPYMPDLCEALLDEPLRLASVPTWWCGEPDGLERVLDHLGGAGALAVRPIDGSADALEDVSRDDLVKLLLAEPHRYVGQERLPLSQAPTWRPTTYGHGEATPRPVTLRTFTLRYGSAYRTLVGGLVSVVEDGRPGASKDLWVLKENASDADQGLPDILPMTSVRSSTGTVPRILEDMFWVGRYAERVEDLLRLVIASHALAEEFQTRPRSTGGAGLDVMMGAVRRLAGRTHADLDEEFRSVLLDIRRRGSVAHGVEGLREAVSGVRDQLSGDVWRTFGATERASASLRTSRHSQQITESAGRMLTGVLALHGVTASMIRDEGWHMIAAGRALERALQLCQLLAATTTVRRGIDVDREVLNAVLVAAESSVTHRRRYRGYVRPGGVLELLLEDTLNPRSLAFVLDELATHLAALPASTGSSRPERLVTDLQEALAETDIATLVAIGGVGRPNLENYLSQTMGQLKRLGEAITELHHTSGPAPRLIAGLPLVDSFSPTVPPTAAKTGEIVVRAHP